ncbi:MAG: biopolymer transporter ExbD [Bacteroidales bacterium]|jgi:biopolymer transport protein ExbD|nr:biopolymer transporter ExbD [Bacteroidales bacterium]
MNLKKTPGINSSSMADVSFILFIFFLMVTTMGTDYGLIRQLPPMVDDIDITQEIKERNVFVVNVNLYDLIQAESKVVEIGQLRGLVKEFFNVNTVGEEFPQKKDTIVGGKAIRMNRTAVVSLQNDRGTSYRTYIQVQNELAAAIHELRDEASLQLYGKKYDDLDEDTQEFIGKKLYPMAISEAEPKEIKKK